VLGGSLRVQAASRSYYEDFRTTPAETEGRALCELVQGRWDSPELRGLLIEVLERDQHLVDFEVPAVGPPGDGRRTLLLNAARLEQEDGDGAALLLFVQDVTERRQQTEALHRRVQELAAADRSKNEFLALLAHELRNPLATLRNAVRGLEEAAGAPAALAAQARAMMVRQIQTMARLIDDLLDAALVTQGKIRLRTERTDLATLLGRAVERIRPLVETRNQVLAVALPPGPLQLDVDPARLELAFGNLLDNASKFTPAGGHLWVTATVEGERDHGEEIVVRIRDEGIGMGAALLPNIFELFAQGDRSYDRTRGGLGIGLMLVRSFVELHGGTVEAQSPGPGRGSELVVRLPLALRHDTGELRRAGVENVLIAGLARSPTASRRVLVIDDVADTAESLALVLRLRGHEVAVAYDGRAALDQALAGRPEVVVIDIGLPEMDGYQVAGELRRQQHTASALLIALSGYGQEENQRRAREAGFDHHLTKPVDPLVVCELVSRPQLLP
jgi:signal transduction histidine kinase/CheY-like chemotaxis protein